LHVGSDNVVSDEDGGVREASLDTDRKLLVLPYKFKDGCGRLIRGCWILEVKLFEFLDSITKLVLENPLGASEIRENKNEPGSIQACSSN